MADVQGRKNESGMAATLFQAVRVVASGGQFSPSAAPDKNQFDSPGTVTLALSPRDCELALVALAKGRLQLSLRPPDDQGLVDLKTADLAGVMTRIRESPVAERPGTVEVIQGTEREDFILQKK
jgi:Flp pilus assembly protein CpaB